MYHLDWALAENSTAYGVIMTNVALFDRVLQEMQETREFLADWFSGRAEKPSNSGDFPLQQRLARDFHTIRPDGTRLDREQTLNVFFNILHGSDPKVLCHTNDNIKVLLETDSLVLVGYDELHVYQDHTRINALTAAFVLNDLAPNGVSWLLVHETPKNEEQL